ncbi:Hypothetical predicted protein, partial [Olea europaea subsp. europaea]
MSDQNIILFATVLVAQYRTLSDHPFWSQKTFDDGKSTNHSIYQLPKIKPYRDQYVVVGDDMYNDQYGWSLKRFTNCEFATIKRPRIHGRKRAPTTRKDLLVTNLI